MHGNTEIFIEDVIGTLATNSLALPRLDDASHEMLASSGEPIWLSWCRKENLTRVEIKIDEVHDPNNLFSVHEKSHVCE